MVGAQPVGAFPVGAYLPMVSTTPVVVVPLAVFTFAIRFEYVQGMDAMLTQVQSSDVRYVRVQEHLTEWVRR